MTLASLSGAELLKKIVLGGGATAGAVMAYELIEIAKTQPKVIEIVASWGPFFVIAIVVMLLIDRNFGQMIALGRDNVQAQQKMADAMREIADKDDRQADELRRLTSYNAVQSEKIMKRMDRQDYWLAQIAEVTKVRLRTEPPVAVAGPVEVEKARGANA